ncbi:MAG: SusC/RagA family TonB-linked outer membrane protein [Bacteroidota bacterium]|nr:SusC/RagA family TonB-linked outer membrane protein [Bacteroidota bacterium]
MRKFTMFLALLFFAGLQGVFAQTRVITGVVTSAEDKSPIPGVTIVVKGTTIGTTTNVDGKYVLSVPTKYDILTFSYVGMKTKEVKLGAANTVDVVLESDVMNMDEIVVTAIGIPRETKALSYSVQAVNSNDIQRASRTDVINALQGKVSDVQIVSSSGVAGAASYIQIRGVQSITGNNQPLWVVDGVPISGSETGGSASNTGAAAAVDGVGISNRAVDINPDDIESINVLKGGAATAMYGLRAASGAIIITTKKGSATVGKKISVNYNTYIQFDKVSKLPALQNQYGQGSNGNWISGNKFAWGPKLDTCSYDKTDFENYKWKDFDTEGKIVSYYDKNSNGELVKTYNPYDFFQTGLTTNNSLSLTGGSDVSNFYFSFSDNQSKGIIPNNKFRRNTFKLSGESKLSDQWKISGSANYIITTGKRIQQGSNTSGLMLGLLRTPCTFNNAGGYQFPSNYQFPDGTYLMDWQNFALTGDETATGYSGNQRGYRHGLYYDNPYWTVNNNIFKDYVNRLIGSAQVDYLTNKWLTFTYRLGVDWYGRRYTDDLAIGSGAQPQGWAKRGEETSKNFNSDLLMTIDRDFAKDFNLHLVVGHNMTQQYFTGLYTQANGLVIPDYYNLNNTTNTSSSESTTELRRAAIYGDLTLAWKSMLYLSLTGRNDWTTTLYQGKNSFFYPSVGMGWIFTQLPGLKDNKILPYGKVRVSYAVVAKDVSPYNTMTYYTTPSVLDGWTDGLTWPYNGTNGYLFSSTLGNKNLKPEKTKSIELGLDLKFIQNRVGVSYTYFNNKGEDLILPVPIAASTGYTSAYMNAGSIRTQGHEITLDLVPIKSKNWEWDVTANFSKITNKVLSLAGGVNRLFLGGFTGSEVDAVVGQPYRTIYGYDWVRDDKGNVMIGDDGYPIMSENMTALGNVDPKWTLGIGSTLRWKDLSLYFLFDIKHGGKMWDGTRGAMDYFGTSAGTLNRGEKVLFEGIVQSTGKANTQEVELTQDWYQGVGSGFVGCTQPYIEDAGWVRLRTVTLSYSLSNLVKKSFIRQLTVYFTGTNLWLYTHYKGVDPETNLLGSDNAQGIDYFNMPGTKSYTIGLNLAF